MLSFSRTNAANTDFIDLVTQLDAELATRDGKEHLFYDQFNKTGNIKYAVVAYEDGRPCGCGAVKEYQPGIMEIKRMYVLPLLRGKGTATKILTELEKWSAELFASKCILETGTKQTEAIALYKKSGYSVIPNYGQYECIPNSICFEKVLHAVH